MSGLTEKQLIYGYGGLTFGVDRLCKHGNVAPCADCDPYAVDPEPIRRAADEVVAFVLESIPRTPKEDEQYHAARARLARPVARNTDPATSHAAAKSVAGIRHSQQLVLSVLQEYGPLTDEGIYRYQRVTNVMSPSGARTRRAELVAMGKVKDSGQRVKLSSGRLAIRWMAVE